MEISRPSARRQDKTSSNCSGERSGRPSPPTDPLRLPVDRDRMAGPGIEDHDAHRGDVDQGLQVGPRPLLGLVPAGVGNRRTGLGRANSARTSSSSRVNSCPPALSAR